MKETKELPLIPLDEFNKKVDEYSATNFLLSNLQKQVENWHWEKLPHHLIQDLFKKLGCKPIINKY